MTTLVLKTVGSVIGGFAGPTGAMIGDAIGETAGTLLTSSSKVPRTQGPRLADLAVQTSTYGKTIPIVFGTVRLAGNIIWSRPIRETATTATQHGGGKGGGGRASQASTSYSYSVSLALSVCEGEITDILRVWADAKPLDLSLGTYRIYAGSETQLPDPFIESFEGVGSTPAYRGLAYVVIEDFPLGPYGNRIPNFTFEVKRKQLSEDIDGVPLEHAITAVTLIPGSGEFVYDTVAQFKFPGTQTGGHFAQTGERVAMNRHTPYGKSNLLVSLDQLAETLPNVAWINVVVNWFGTSLSAGACNVLPGVEYATGGITQPESWSCAGRTRLTAHPIGNDAGALRYGGTPDDQSLLRLLDELRARGYKILLTPMFVMDIAGKPWRGQVTGSAGDVANFFTKTGGYNAFATHYAALCAAKIDAFAIGSELVGLTKVASGSGIYPAVSALVSLAASVRAILAAETKITYAADWSEYHHTDGGWYHLDPLWASANIDVVGIDAYFPLSDAPQSGYDLGAAVAGWGQGEGYDWYYTDPGRTTKASLSPAYAWKNIAWWWSNAHVNPDASTSAWVPESKPVWFTEYGFPSVDGALNQPNVFYDPTSSASAFPYHSKGRVDIRAQRLGLAATEAQWAGSAMVQRKFAWTWDARPYPCWPDLTQIWGDGANWSRGHWLQGKMGLSSLGAIVGELCRRAGLPGDQVETHRLENRVDGYVISDQQSVRAAMEGLMAAYFFDAVESGDVLRFVPRGNAPALEIPEADLVPPSSERKPLVSVMRGQEMELPQRIYLIYLNRERDYQASTQIAQRSATESEQAITLNLPLVLPDQLAKQIADAMLYTEWVGRTTLEFELPTRYARLEPCDVVTVSHRGVLHTVRITSVQGSYPGRLRVRAVAEDAASYDSYTVPGQGIGSAAPIPVMGPTRLECLDLPAFPGEAEDAANLRLAVAGTNAEWRGAALYRSDDAGADYSLQATLLSAAVIGSSLDALPPGVTAVFDHAHTLTVALLPGGELASAGEFAVLNGANSALLGQEIFQFTTATLLTPGIYQLTGLLRGRLGTEWAMGAHGVGERFVLLDGAVAVTPAQSLIGLPRLFKPVTLGATPAGTAAQSFTYSGEALRPLAPVHVSGARDGSLNLSVTWVRRARGGEWRDYIDVPLGESAEAYEIDILNGATVVRTLSGLSTPQAGYSAAQQAADFGAAQPSVSMRIYQLSARIGRGHGAAAMV